MYQLIEPNMTLNDADHVGSFNIIENPVMFLFLMVLTSLLW